MDLWADEKVPTELKKAIMQARMDKKLTQAQLAQVLLTLPAAYILCHHMFILSSF